MQQKTFNTPLESIVHDFNEKLLEQIADKYIAINHFEPLNMIIILKDKLSLLAELYRLYQGTEFAELPKVLEQNYSQVTIAADPEFSSFIEEENEDNSLNRLTLVLHSFFCKIIKHCIRIEIEIVLEKLNDNTPINVEDKSALIAAIAYILATTQNITAYVQAIMNLTPEESQLLEQHARVLNNLFQLSSSISDHLSHFDAHCKTDAPIEIEINNAVLSIAKLLEKHAEDLVKNKATIIAITDIFEILNNALDIISRKIQQSNEKHMRSISQQDEIEQEQNLRLLLFTENHKILDSTAKKLPLLPQKYCQHDFNLAAQTTFFSQPRFHILTPYTGKNTEFSHLAHFYLICKRWPMSKEAYLPNDFINLILCVVLQLSTLEEKKKLYAGLTGGLEVTQRNLTAPINVQDYVLPLMSVENELPEKTNLTVPMLIKMHHTMTNETSFHIYGIIEKGKTGFKKLNEIDQLTKLDFTQPTASISSRINWEIYREIVSSKGHIPFLEIKESDKMLKVEKGFTCITSSHC